MKNLITELYTCYNDVDSFGIHLICDELYGVNPNDSLLFSLMEYNKISIWSFNHYTLYNKSVCILLKRLCVKYRKGLTKDEYPDQDIVQVEYDVDHFLKHIFELSTYDKLMLNYEINV